MRETDPTRVDLVRRRLTRSISAKLIGSLLAVMVVIFALLGYVNIRLHRQQLEADRLASAERISDVIKRSATYYMLRNDREGLYHVIRTLATSRAWSGCEFSTRKGGSATPPTREK